MARFVVGLSALMLAGLPVASVAKEFLGAANQITAEDIRQVLQAEMSGLVDSTRLQSIQEDLRPMYAALPKSEQGQLEPSTVRYALHRYFMQKYAWHIKGISSTEGTWNSSSAGIMTDRAPAYIQGLFEERLHGRGLDLHDLAVFAATLADLVRKELLGDLETVYKALDMPVDRPVPEGMSERANSLYLARYLVRSLRVNDSASTLDEFEEAERMVSTRYLAWEDTTEFSHDLHLTKELLQSPRRNPFVHSHPSFSESVASLEEFGHRFGSLQNLECHSLKEKLLDMEQHGTGRVPLKRFYGNWYVPTTTFTETVPYLRHIGALDESNPSSMSVVIPNYLTGQSNCLGGSSYHLVCCHDECDYLLSRVEKEIKAPSASPARIAEVVSALGSDTVHAPRNLSSALLGRLDEIAEHHGGRVVLHGRLFAQWMHHAFPRECTFPHSGGNKMQMRPGEWQTATGVSSEATDAEMIAHLGGAEVEEMPLPWTAVEELVAGHKRVATAADLPNALAPLRLAAAFALLVSLVIPLVRTGTVSTTKLGNDCCKSHLV